jgi:hypothetical protein
MKTKNLLRIFITVLIILTCSFQDLKSQANQLDSLIYGKNLKFIGGTIPTYYSLPCETRAIDIQSLFHKVVEIYSNNDPNAFKLRLAVIDSSQWTGFNVPYGFSFINPKQGWIVIPGDLNYQKFANLMGFYPFSDVVIKNVGKLSQDPESLLTDVFYKYTSIHELGHYYRRNILKASAPDWWTNEWIASYFATDFLYHNDRKSLEVIDIYTSTYAKEFVPKHRTLADFDSTYAGLGLQNYCWYHAMFQPMIEDIYSTYKKDFMVTYAKTFPITNDQPEISQEELLKTLDNITGGKTSKWIKIMEGAPK